MNELKKAIDDAIDQALATGKDIDVVGYAAKICHTCESGGYLYLANDDNDNDDITDDDIECIADDTSTDDEYRYRGVRL